MNIFDIKPGDTITAWISPQALGLKGTKIGKPKRIKITGTAVGFSLAPDLQINVLMEGKNFMPWVDTRDIIEVEHTAPPGAEFRYIPVAMDEKSAVQCTPVMSKARRRLLDVLHYAGRPVAVELVDRIVGDALRYMTPNQATRLLDACDAALEPFAGAMLDAELQREAERARALQMGRDLEKKMIP